MNPEVDKVISDSLQGTQWLFLVILIILFLYLVFKRNKKPPHN